MKHTRFLFSSLGVLMGCSILAISLTAGNVVQSSTGNFEATHKQFYLSHTLLPNHVAYPALMAIDRIKLEAVEPSERVYMQVEYARRRFEYAQELVNQNELALALTTTTKAEKYLINAAHQALKLENGRNQQLFVYHTLVYYNAELEALKHSFPDSDRTIIDHLQQEMLVLQEQLK